jgi:hypothetical protein
LIFESPTGERCIIDRLSEEVVSMKTLLPVLPVCSLLCLLAQTADANPIASSWGLHWAGEHNPSVNTCNFNVTDCATTPKGDLVINAPAEAGYYDVYVLALMTWEIKTVSFGVCCEGPIEIVDWTSCADFESPTPGWPGCGEGYSLSWIMPRGDFNVILGILEVEVYGSPAKLCVCPDPRLGYAEMCYEAGSELYCEPTAHPSLFSCVGFEMPGYNTCDFVATDKSTWGLVKALYR